MIKMSRSEDGYYAPTSLCNLRADGSIRSFKGCGGCFAGLRTSLPCEQINSDGSTNCDIANIMNEYAILTGQANQKEDKIMLGMENGMEGMFHGMFGRIDHGMCAGCR